MSPAKRTPKKRKAPAASKRPKAVSKPTKAKPAARPSRSPRRATSGSKRKTAPVAKAKTTPAAKAKTAEPVRRLAVVPTPPAPAPPPEPEPKPAPKKPTFYDAIAIYEAGVRGLQRHDYSGAADAFRQVLEKYPEERELIERARLYLRVCERETEQRAASPQTTPERVYAATVALNAGNSDAALAHLVRALEQDPRSDHAHYIMAVVRSSRFETDRALEHLRRSIELNPDNRSLALQDADLADLRGTAGFRLLVGDDDVEPASRARGRR